MLGKLDIAYTNDDFDSFTHWVAQMYFSVINRRNIAIWLSAILLILSVAASAHSVEHFDEGAKTHCTLCFHQHQLDQVLPQQDANLEVISQQYQLNITVRPTLVLTPSVNYLSRAPPVIL